MQSLLCGYIFTTAGVGSTICHRVSSMWSLNGNDNSQPVCHSLLHHQFNCKCWLPLHGRTLLSDIVSLVMQHGHNCTFNLHFIGMAYFAYLFHSVILLCSRFSIQLMVFNNTWGNSYYANSTHTPNLHL